MHASKNEWEVDGRTYKLLKALTMNPRLARHVYKACFKVKDTSQQSKESPAHVDCGKVVRGALKLMPRLDALDLDSVVWNSKLTGELLFSYGTQWKELTIGGVLFNQQNGTGEKSWSHLPNLTKLRCQEVSRRRSRLYVPSGIKQLDIKLNGRGPYPLKFSPNPQLLVFRAVSSENKLGQLASLQRLKHLHIDVWRDAGSDVLSVPTLSALAHLPRLQYLTISIVRGPPFEITSLVLPLLASLPRSLVQLDFPIQIPFRGIKNLLSTNCPPQLEILGLRPHSSNSEIAVLEYNRHLRQILSMCETKGIAVEWITYRSRLHISFVQSLLTVSHSSVNLVLTLTRSLHSCLV